MNHAYSRLTIAAGLLIAALVIGVWQEAQAQNVTFGNYYVPPVGPNGVGAQLYPSPRPTPPLVGHTYITYEPLAPHEFMYRHRRVHWTSHADAPPTRTSVRYGTFGSPVSGLLTPR